MAMSYFFLSKEADRKYGNLGKLTITPHYYFNF